MVRTFVAEQSDETADSIFWFVRKKMFFFNMATFAPYVGTALQVLEVYAVGQFTIVCASRSGSLDTATMRSKWDGIQEEILSSAHVIVS